MRRDYNYDYVLVNDVKCETKTVGWVDLYCKLQVTVKFHKLKVKNSLFET